MKKTVSLLLLASLFICSSNIFSMQECVFDKEKLESKSSDFLQSIGSKLVESTGSGFSLKKIVKPIFEKLNCKFSRTSLVVAGAATAIGLPCFGAYKIGEKIGLNKEIKDVVGAVNKTRWYVKYPIYCSIGLGASIAAISAYLALESKIDCEIGRGLSSCTKGTLISLSAMLAPIVVLVDIALKSLGTILFVGALKKAEHYKDINHDEKNGINILKSINKTKILKPLLALSPLIITAAQCIGFKLFFLDNWKFVRPVNNFINGSN